MSERSQRLEGGKKERRIHPIWQVIGWIWIVLMVVISAAGSRVLSQYNRINYWVPLSKEVAQPIILPVVTAPFLSFPLDFNRLIQWIPGYPFYVDEVVLFVGLMFISFGFMSVIYAFMWSRVVPMRGPYDAPEMDVKARKRRR